MKSFLDDSKRIDELKEFLELHRQYVLANMEEVDSDVENQKSRFYKLKCWLIWGHLVKKGKNTCSRCGKVLITNINNPIKS